MSFLAALQALLAASCALLLALAATTAAARAARRARARRQRRRAAPHRPLLLLVATGEAEEAAAAADRLRRLPRWQWDAVQASAVSLLGKVRGNGQRELVAVLAGRGITAAAHRDLGARSAVARARAAELLGHAADATAAPALVALLADPHPDVRQVSARALGAVGDPAAAAALLACLRGPAPRVPADVVARALLRLGAPAVPALVEGLASPSAQVRLVAAEVLGRLGAVSARSALDDVLLRDEVPAVRGRAATALGRLGAPQSLAALGAATRPSVPAGVRAAAVRALGELGDDRAVPVLWALLGDPDERTGAGAARSLLGLGAPGVRLLAEVAAQEAVGAAAAVGRAHEALAGAVLAEVLPAPLAAEAVARAAGSGARRLLGAGG